MNNLIIFKDIPFYWDAWDVFKYDDEVFEHVLAHSAKIIE